MKKDKIINTILQLVALAGVCFAAFFTLRLVALCRALANHIAP